MSHSPRHSPLIFGFEALLFLSCLFGLYRLAEKASVLAIFAEEGDHAVVREVTSAEMIGLQPNDVVRSVNGYAVMLPDDIEFVLDGSQIGDIASFDIERDSRSQTVSTVLVPHYGVRYLIILLIVGSFFFALGVFILVKHPKDEEANVFHWLAISVALMMMTTWGRYTIQPFGLGHALMVLNSLAYALVPALFVHFTFVFPRRKWSGAENMLVPLYALAVAVAVWRSATFLLATFPLSMDWFRHFMTAFDVSRWFFAACIVFGVANLFYSYRTAVEEYERRKLRWVILGLAVGSLGFVTLWQIPEALGLRPLVEEEFILVIAAVIPFTFAVSIVRYHLMDIDLVFNRSTVYVIVLGLLLAIYALVVGIIASIVGTFTVASSLAASAVAAVVVALLFEPAREHVQRFVDKRFFRVRYNFREAQRRLIEEIKRCLDVRQLADLVVSQTEQLIPVERVGFFTLEKPGSRLRLLAHRHYDMLALHSVRFVAERLRSSLRLPVALDGKIEPGVPFESADVEVFRRWGMALVLTVMSDGDEIVGFLVLGEKKSGTRFSAEDIDLLNAVTTEAGLVIARITLQQKLLLEHAEAQRLEELNRLKSYFVSSVSHELKTPLTSIKMFAEMLQSKKKIPTRNMREYLEIIAGESDRLARLITNVLDFAKVERGVKDYHFSDVKVNEVVRSVMRSLRYQFKMEKIKVNVHLSQKEHIIHADADALAEALLNLLSNAMKYSVEKKHITVSTFRKDPFIVVRVEDKGIGISEEELKSIFDPFYRARNERVQSLGGAGLGLTLVRHIMEAHGGEIKVSSTPGQGSTFTLLFPLEARHETHSRH